MRKLWALSVGLLIIAGPLAAAEPTGKVVLETWDAAYLEDAKAGYVHTIVHQFDQDGQKRFRTSTELNLTVKRFNDDISLRMETGCEEDEKGKVTAVSMKQFTSKDQKLIQNGTVEGKQLHITVDEVRGEQTKRVRDFKNPWNDEVMGLYRQERLFRDKKIKPGDQFSYLSFEPTISYVVTTKVTVKDFEEVDLRGVKKQLLRVIAAPEKITVGETSIQLPPADLLARQGIRDAAFPVRNSRAGQVEPVSNHQATGARSAGRQSSADQGHRHLAAGPAQDAHQSAL